MYLVLNFKSNLGTYGHDFLAYERDTRGVNLHPGVNLLPGANLQPVQIVHMNTALVSLLSCFGFLLWSAALLKNHI